MRTAVARDIGEGLYQLHVETGEFSFPMDEPVANGGLGTGPNPFDLLRAALASCTLMTMKLYAERKGLGPGGLRVDVTHHPGSADARDRFDRFIEFGDATDEQRAGLLRIAERCPVHLLFERGADVTVATVDTPHRADIAARDFQNPPRRAAPVKGYNMATAFDPRLRSPCRRPTAISMASRTRWPRRRRS